MLYDDHPCALIIGNKHYVLLVTMILVVVVVTMIINAQRQKPLLGG